MATLLETVMRKYAIPCRIWINGDVKSWKKHHYFSFFIDIITANRGYGLVQGYYLGEYLESHSLLRIHKLRKACMTKFYNHNLRISAKGNMFYKKNNGIELIPLIELKDIPRFFKNVFRINGLKLPISNMNEFIGTIHKCKEEIIHDLLSPREMTTVEKYIRSHHE